MTETSGPVLPTNRRHNMNNDNSDVEKNTDINFDMEITIGQVSLNHDIRLSW